MRNYTVNGLINAAYYGDIETIKDAIANGCNVDIHDEDNSSLLCYAATSDNVEMVEIVAKALKQQYAGNEAALKVALNAQDKDGETALFFTTSSQVAEYLIGAGADVTLTNKRENCI